MERNSKTVIINNVKRLRKSLKLTKEELSLLLDFDNSYIAKLECGKITPTIERLDKIACFFQIETSEIIKEKLKVKRYNKISKVKYLNKEVREIIGFNIAKYRQKMNFSKEELSQKLGFSESYISKAEKGLLNITIDKITLIADFFNIQVIDLFK